MGQSVASQSEAGQAGLLEDAWLGSWEGQN